MTVVVLPVLVAALGSDLVSKLEVKEVKLLASEKRPFLAGCVLWLPWWPPWHSISIVCTAQVGKLPWPSR